MPNYISDGSLLGALLGRIRKFYFCTGGRKSEKVEKNSINNAGSNNAYYNAAADATCKRKSLYHNGDS